MALGVLLALHYLPAGKADPLRRVRRCSDRVRRSVPRQRHRRLSPVPSRLCARTHFYRTLPTSPIRSALREAMVRGARVSVRGATMEHRPSTATRTRSLCGQACCGDVTLGCGGNSRRRATTEEYVRVRTSRGHPTLAHANPHLIPRKPSQRPLFNVSRRRRRDETPGSSRFASPFVTPGLA